MARKPVNARQLEVLRWIADGCPDGVMADDTYKQSAAALKSRHLVTISKRDAWRATIAPDGAYYLEHGHYPGATKTSMTSRLRRPQTTPRTPPSPSAPTPANSQGEARLSEGETQREGREEPAQPARDIPVLEQLRRPHAVVVQLRDDKSHFDITGPARRRALLVAQGLISGCEREGWTVTPVSSQRDGWGRTTWEAKHHFWVDTGECKIGIRFVQEQDRTPHEPTPYEVAQKKRYEWTNIPKYDHTPSDRLRIELGSGRRTNYSDGKRMALPSKLPMIVAAIHEYHEVSYERRLENERREAERAERWEAAMSRAKLLLRESHRAAQLSKQVDKWRQARELREYVRTLEHVASSLEGSDREAAEEWISWATQECERIDPLNQPIRMPDDPEPTLEALKPFLGGWSPYGPRGW